MIGLTGNPQADAAIKVASLANARVEAAIAAIGFDDVQLIAALARLREQPNAENVEAALNLAHAIGVALHEVQFTIDARDGRGDE